jgi:hypothetical protein
MREGRGQSAERERRGQSAEGRRSRRQRRRHFFFRALPSALCALLVACVRTGVVDDVTVEIEKNDRALVTVQTRFNDENSQTPAQLAVVEAARAAAQNATDAWSVRFARLTTEDESVTIEKHLGKVERAIRAVRIPSSELQQAFSDMNITVHLLDGGNWRELAFYPGGSVRGTSEQRRHFDHALIAWSSAVANYFVAIDHLYTYLNANPQRAPHLLAAVLNEKIDGDDPIVAEEEQPLIDHVAATMDEIATQMDAQEEGGATFAEEADLLYNPFPARLTVRVPGDIITSEGFPKDMIIEPVNLLTAITSLEGRWISPDPLATLLRKSDETPMATRLAAQPRMSTATVNASDVSTAIREQLVRPKAYVVRWRD